MQDEREMRSPQAKKKRPAGRSFLSLGVAVRVFAPGRKRAAFARGLARGAHAPAVEDDPVMREAPLFPWNVLHQLLLSLEHVIRVR